MNSDEVKVMKVEENDARKSSGYCLNDNVLHLACETDQSVC